MDNQNPVSQRRNLAILFSDLCESTRISGALEPEQFAALLEQLRALYDAIIGRHGGMIVRIDGDGVTCAFGYPGALDDAGRRATEAALDLHAAAATLDQSFAFPEVSIRLHSGIHSGVVLVREGDLVRGRIEILGDTTNVAARLCDHATADQIVVSEESLGADRHFFLAEPASMVSLKGRKNSVPALLISGRNEVATRFAARSKRAMAPFCGRTAELSQLHRLLDQGRGAGVMRVSLIGAVGLGKTRLLNEFLDQAGAAGVTVHRGYCEAYLGARALQPFEQIAQSLDGDNAPASAIPERLLRWAQTDCASQAILAIDDWQWADDATHRLLEEIVRSRPCNLLVILARRPEGAFEISAPDDVRIDLKPLTPTESKRAITALLDTEDPFRIGRIQELSGGSPLFIEELCHIPAASLPGQNQQDSSAWLDSLIHARFLDLPKPLADLVRTTSVIGHMVPIGLFAAVTGIGAGDPVLTLLAASDFLYKGEIEGTLKFKHALTRDVIYRTVGFDERRQLHALVADRLEALAAQDAQEDFIDALAYHHFEAGDHAAALPYAVKAGDAALVAGALDRAQRHFELAFLSHQALGKPFAAGPSIVELVTRYGRACVIDPSREQVPILMAMTNIVHETGDRAGSALALYWLGSIQFGLGDARLAIASLTDGLDHALDSARPALAAQMRAALGASWFDIGGSSRALDLLEQATTAMRTDLTESRIPAYLYAVANMAQILADRGDFARSAQHFAEVDTVAGQTDAPVLSSLMTQRATVHIWQGDYGNAAAYGQMAEQRGIRSRSRQNAMYGRALSSYAQFMQAGESAAADRLSQTLQWLDASPYRHRISLFYGWGAEVMALTGRASEGRHWAARAFARRRFGDSFGTASAARAMARLAAGGSGLRAPGHYLALAERADNERKSAWSAAATAACRSQLDLPARTNAASDRSSAP